MPSASTPTDLLQQIWGYSTFLPQQAAAIEATLTERDSLVVMPTGGGKSLCYQIPPLVRDHLSVVVSPLISLMKDQVDTLRSLGVNAGALNSSIPISTQRQVYRDWEEGALRLLYVSPERLLTGEILSRLKSRPPLHFAIDEAHCISSWGHDFRPEYRSLAQLKFEFPRTPIAALTATATPQVREDIVRQLSLRDPAVLVGSFYRSNLIYHVQRRHAGYNQISTVLDRHRGQPGIVYAISRRRVEELSDLLNKLGHKTLPYHAKLSDQQKVKHQEALEQDEVDAIVATIAFGMGIDKSNVRYVVHAEMPRSIENYQQESGRAGRDGLPAECWLFHSSGDYHSWRRLLQTAPAEHQSRSLAALDEISRFCTKIACRHRSLVEYFGQTFDQECRSCDVCLQQVVSVEDPLKLGQMILSCVYRCGQNFGMDHVTKVLVGSQDKKVLQHGHEKLSTWGLLSNHPRGQVRDWLDQLLGQGYLERQGEFSVLQLTHKGRDLLKGQETPNLVGQTKSPAATTSLRTFDSWEDVDRELFGRLREERRVLAEEAGVPAFIVMSDATLRDLARRRPTREETLLAVHGIGQKKVADYGSRLMRVIADWCQSHQLTTDIAMARTSASRQDKTKTNKNAMEAFPLFEQGLSVEEIATRLHRAVSTIHDYLLTYIAQQQVTDPGRWVEPELAEKIRIANQFNDTGRLRPLFDAFHGQVSYETLRIVLKCEQQQQANTRS